MTDRGVLLKRNGRIGFTFAFIASGIAHFLSPRLFIALIPKRVPGRPFLVYISGLVELLLAVGLWQKRWRKLAAQGTLGLMLLFLPLHVVDIFREKPIAGGRKWTAVLRLIAQFGLIGLAKEMTTDKIT
ncbi:MAG: hypothetical protein H6653_12360 [Ardenticatenaceae bacterium]|nr:hypothetical protein [Ardenticatenaceae bacterium]